MIAMDPADRLADSGLCHMSLNNKGHHQRGSREPEVEDRQQVPDLTSKKGSQYQLSFLPMAQGLRTKVWREGFEVRNKRKVSGFNHFELEWVVPTDRSVGRPKGSWSPRGRTPFKAQTSPQGGVTPPEALVLPRTKLQKKRARLARLYLKSSEGKRGQIEDGPDEGPRLHPKEHDKAKDPKDQPKKAKGPGVTGARGGKLGQVQAEYEKNKRNNLKSNIQLPVGMATPAGSVESRSGGRMQYGYKCFFSSSPHQSRGTQQDSSSDPNREVPLDSGASSSGRHDPPNKTTNQPSKANNTKEH